MGPNGVELAKMAEYPCPESLVSTEWVLTHQSDPSVRVVEVDVDATAYDEGHVPNSIAWAWNSQLCDMVCRDILSQSQFENLMASSGITPTTTVVIYGDNNNWFSAWALWQMKIYGHKDVRIMNGGRKKWLSEGRDLSTNVPRIRNTAYTALRADPSLRAFLSQVQSAVQNSSADLVDVRSPQEFSGEILAPPGLHEACQRGGHIPGARNSPGNKTCKDDGTFKTFDELKALYGSFGVDGSKPVIAYCRIGERASHTWFVLKYLLGLEKVANYDGSWSEWGNLVGAPVEKGRSPNEGSPMTAEEYGGLQVEVGGWLVNLVTYRLEETYHCRADNGSEGATLTRTTGQTREESEQRALDRVRQLVARTKRH
jgi:thiosulfate/3-mercaptopyruvate sulfurtransferase